MLENLLIATSWCSLNDRNYNSHTSNKCYEKNWLGTIWKDSIEKTVKPKIYYIYESLCDNFFDSCGFSSRFKPTEVHAFDIGPL